MMNNLITPDLVTPESLIPVPSTTEKPNASQWSPVKFGKNPHKTRNRNRTTRLEIKSMKPSSFYSNFEDAPRRIKNQYARLKARDI